MGKLWDFIAGPATSLVGAVGGVIDDLVTSDEERLAVKQQLVRLEHEFQRAVMDADVEFAREQSKVLQAEITGQSWLQRNWRPIVMLSFATIVVYTYFVGPMFGLPYIHPMPELFWSLLTVGIGGYVFGRSAEKIIPQSKWAKE